jgi:hypothetical protein
VNEYTRREEVRWTLLASLLMVLCIAPAVIFLVTAKGKLVPDMDARKAADDAAEHVKPVHACVQAAKKLRDEMGAFKDVAKAAHLDAADDSDPGKKPPKKQSLAGRLNRKLQEKEKEPDIGLAWNAAQPSQKAAKQLVEKDCKVLVEAATGARADEAPVWETIGKIADIHPATDDKKEELDATRAMLKLLADLPVDKIVQHATDAVAATQKHADELSAAADVAKKTEPLPDGVLVKRQPAVGLGVGLSVIALLLSYLSVRVVSNRRLSTLVPLREAAKMSQPGVHAAAVLRLASQPNGGLPGAVIGSAFGGLIAAAVAAVDTDVFIGGVMLGFLFGLGVQFLYGMLMGASRWRQRATELAEIEKPAIPIVLVLSGVNPGLEAQFVKFFNALSPAEAATTVEKLASQAEERILAAADAGAAANGAPGGMPPGGMPPGGMPPGMPPGGMMPPG